MNLRTSLLTLLLIFLLGAVPVSVALGEDGKKPESHTNGNDEDSTKPATTTTTTGVVTPAPSTQGSAPGGDNLPPAGPPVLGKAVEVAPVSGEVRVRLPGSPDFVALSRDAQVPTGAVLDTTHGVVTLKSAHNTHGGVQSADFSGAQFGVTQARAERPVTALRLRGEDFSRCAPSAGMHGFAMAARSQAVGRLWGSGKGRFRTQGRYGSATVRGTVWLTEDRCDGTRVRVARGLVAVRDAVRHKTIMVAAGHSHLIRPRR